jgi:BirA family biotin operon repressor/biotin-[acetyl-CoA-carboxylase] ligase
MSPEAAERSRHLAGFLHDRRLAWLDRFIVLDECGSTQDEAFAAASGAPGLVVSSLRQRRGRGRPGKTWNQRDDLGLAVTFVLDRAAHDAAWLPLRAACAVCHACERLVDQWSPTIPEVSPLLRIKWPNDVMVAPGACARHGASRKLAGILVEGRDNLLLLGIGINIHQGESDWPEPLRTTAVSMAQICKVRPQANLVLVGLIEALDQVLFESETEVLRQFAARDIVTGTRRTIEHDNRRFEGVVEHLDPRGFIRVRLDNGVVVSLPTAASTLVSGLPQS